MKNPIYYKLTVFKRNSLNLIYINSRQNSKSENVSCTYEFQNVMGFRNSTSKITACFLFRNYEMN